MWGEQSASSSPAPTRSSPQVQPFVDEDAEPEVAEKVRRRLGHWIDRRIAALFQPLIALRDDEALTGMARGIAFRLVEALGVLPRAEIAEEVKGSTRTAAPACASTACASASTRSSCRCC